MKRFIIPLALAITTAMPAHADDTQDQFFDNLHTMCGFAFKGVIGEDSTNDPVWAQSLLLLDVTHCTDKQITMILMVGDDASRALLVTKTEQGLVFRHRQTLDNGQEADLSGYGGSAAPGGTPNEQSFPADAATKAMFDKNDLSFADDNTWILSIDPGDMFKYRLVREGRAFEIDFDLHPPKFDGIL